MFRLICVLHFCAHPNLVIVVVIFVSSEKSMIKVIFFVLFPCINICCRYPAMRPINLLKFVMLWLILFNKLFTFAYTMHNVSE